MAISVCQSGNLVTEQSRSHGVLESGFSFMNLELKRHLDRFMVMKHLEGIWAKHMQMGLT